jgi:hypothetical protein
MSKLFIQNYNKVNKFNYNKNLIIGNKLAEINIELSTKRKSEKTHQLLNIRSRNVSYSKQNLTESITLNRRYKLSNNLN